MSVLGGGIAERACRQDSHIVYSSGTKTKNSTKLVLLYFDRSNNHSNNTCITYLGVP